MRSYFDDLSSHKFGIKMIVDADDVRLVVAFSLRRSSDLVSSIVGVDRTKDDWDRDDGADSDSVLYWRSSKLSAE